MSFLFSLSAWNAFAMSSMLSIPFNSEMTHFASFEVKGSFYFSPG